MNFRATDWVQFKKELAKKLEEIPVEEQLQDEIQIDAAVQRIEEAVLSTMEETVPKSKPSPYAKR